MTGMHTQPLRFSGTDGMDGWMDRWMDAYLPT
ncbi:hypothetical protein CGRA01v4_13019 [Colletotrichum graminicola]|nr:hypothetical protein CGRA01v4_13019 [Colletotrichum graminicola]